MINGSSKNQFIRWNFEAALRQVMHSPRRLNRPWTKTPPNLKSNQHPRRGHARIRASPKELFMSFRDLITQNTRPIQQLVIGCKPTQTTKPLDKNPLGHISLEPDNREPWYLSSRFFNYSPRKKPIRSRSPNHPAPLINIRQKRIRSMCQTQCEFLDALDVLYTTSWENWTFFANYQNMSPFILNIGNKIASKKKKDYAIWLAVEFVMILGWGYRSYYNFLMLFILLRLVSYPFELIPFAIFLWKILSTNAKSKCIVYNFVMKLDYLYHNYQNVSAFNLK